MAEQIPQNKKGLGVNFDDLNRFKQRIRQEIADGQMASNGIPVYDNEWYQNAPEYLLPDQFIATDNLNPDDIAQSPITTSFTNTDNSSYIGIMFSAIRSLQAELTKMKNSFQYGLYSYTGTQTAMSTLLGQNKDINPEEPLWATQEQDLSEVSGALCPLSSGHNLEPKTSVTSGEGKLIIDINGATWTDGEEMGYLSIVDPKCYLFLTTSGLNVKLTLRDIGTNSEENDIVIDLNSLGFTQSTSEMYNILIIVSKAVSVTKNNTTNWYGDNYVWISVQDYGTKIAQYGYYDPYTNSLKKLKCNIGDPNNLQGYRYYINNVEFKSLTLTKFKAYSKYQDFSTSIEPTVVENEEDYKYRVAHITIRSVTNKAELDTIKDQLPPNELIYDESLSLLWIKKKDGTVKKLAGGGGSEDVDDEGMTQSEILTWLQQQGINIAAEGNNPISITNLGSVTFVHQSTGKQFKFEVDGNGKLEGKEITGESMTSYLASKNFTVSTETQNFNNYRGLIGMVGELDGGFVTAGNKNSNKDLGLYADRVRIGSIYAPDSNQVSYGCSHAYVELENTSNINFPLKDCQLHYFTGTCATEASGNDSITHYVLELDGILPAGGTYLIRGKKYSVKDNDPNLFIKVDTYDQEWYDEHGNLVDFTISNNNTFVLTYNMSTLPASTTLFRTASEADKKNTPYYYHPNFIDSVSIKDHVRYKTASCITPPENKFTKPTRCNDCLYKNCFELDPAKQAFQSCTAKDSSRYRNNNAADYQYVSLASEYITFPKTPNAKFPVSNYTPKASYEHKTVATDKTKPDYQKPNMVTCAFGINIHTTRCFNWISCGQFDEYIWIRKKGTTAWSNRFESYKSSATYPNDATADGMVKKSFGTFTDQSKNGAESSVESVAYDRMFGFFPGEGSKYTAHKCIIQVKSAAPTTVDEYEYVVGRADINLGPDPEHTSKVMSFTLYPTDFTPRIFQTTDQQGFHWIEYQSWAAAAIELNKTIEAAKGTNNANKIIPILINTGDMTQSGARINEWLDYYNAGECLFDHLEQMNCVGNNDLCDSVDDVKNGEVVTRSFEKLGTGDDNGKSNSYYHHLFYCYEMDTNIKTIISNPNTSKYCPSIYYFENTANSTAGVGSWRFIVMNTEFTEVTCKNWFKQINSDGDTVNVYTGWSIAKGEAASKYDTRMASTSGTVYTMLYNMLNGASTNSQHSIIICHEMPFTVVTNANLSSTGETMQKIDRSLKESATGSLVGCHCNRLNYSDKTSIYWFSRLLEHFNVKLAIGGHKHTYACTNPLRELYFYDNGAKCSLTDGPMTMESTLANDNKVSWSGKVMLVNSESDVVKQYVLQVPRTTAPSSPIKGDVYKDGDVYKYYDGSAWQTIAADKKTLDIDTTKFPIMVDDTNFGMMEDNVFYPYYGVPSDSANKVVYMMCQATGFKQKSNKELPSPQQKFSLVIPFTNVGATSDKPDKAQQAPMFCEYELIHTGDKYKIFLYRVEGIQSANGNLLTQFDYGTGAASYKYLSVNVTVAAYTSDDKAYAVNDVVLYNSKYYRCTAAITKEANTGWSAVSSKFAQISAAAAKIYGNWSGTKSEITTVQ